MTRFLSGLLNETLADVGLYIRNIIQLNIRKCMHCDYKLRVFNRNMRFFDVNEKCHELYFCRFWKIPSRLMYAFPTVI